MQDDIVIVGAARTPVGAFNGAFGSLPAHELGKAAIKEALKRAGVEGEAGFRSHHRPDPHRRSGPEPRPPGLDQRRHSGGKPGLGREPAVRLGLARSRARLSGDPERRQRDRGRGRPGVHEHGAARRVPARGPEDGLARDRRHDDQGRPVGCVQRLPHGHDGRERRRRNTRSPASSRTSSRSHRRTRPRPRRRPASSRTRSCRSPSRAARATSSSTPTSIRRPA